MIKLLKISPARVAVTIAAAISILSFWFFYAQGSTLGYKDTFSHLEIGRRIVVGQATGFGQLGGIWLPLQHLLMIPTVWSDALYLSGVSGSLLSMVAYVVSVWAVFRIVYNLTASLPAAWLSVAVFGLNPNLLYSQSTPMGETMMYAGILLSILGLIRWVQTDRYQYLMLASLAVFALTLTRYEGWIMAIALMGVVSYVCIYKRYPLLRGNQKGQGLVLAFSFLALLGVAAWLLWNQLIFGDWLNWLHGQYSSQDQTNQIAPQQVGNLKIAMLTYWYGMVHTVTVPVIVLAVLGATALAIKQKASPIAAIVLSSLVPGAFLAYGLYSGNQPMHVMEVDGSIYNLRFGVVMLIPCSILIGYLVSMLPQKFFIRTVAAATGSAIALGFAVMTFASDTTQTIITNREAHEAIVSLTEQRQLSQWLDEHTTGRILAESFENERVIFDVQSRVVYEGTTASWPYALSNPTAEDIEVIVMRQTAGNTDTVYDAMHGQPVLDNWTIVHETESYVVYTTKAKEVNQ